MRNPLIKVNKKSLNLQTGVQIPRVLPNPPSSSWATPKGKKRGSEREIDIESEREIEREREREKEREIEIESERELESEIEREIEIESEKRNRK